MPEEIDRTEEPWDLEKKSYKEELSKIETKVVLFDEGTEEESSLELSKNVREGYSNLQWVFSSEPGVRFLCSKKELTADEAQDIFNEFYENEEEDNCEDNTE